MYVWFLWSAEESIGYPGTIVVDGCELPCGCLELNPHPLGEEQVLISLVPSVQPCGFNLNLVSYSDCLPNKTFKGFYIIWVCFKP